jgi:hypothetical protein
MYNCVLTILTPEATDPGRLLVNGLCTYFFTFIDKYSNVYQCFSLLSYLDRFGLHWYRREWAKTSQMVFLGRLTLRRVFQLGVEGRGATRPWNLMSDYRDFHEWAQRSHARVILCTRTTSWRSTKNKSQECLVRIHLQRSPSVIRGEVIRDHVGSLSLCKLLCFCYVFIWSPDSAVSIETGLQVAQPRNGVSIPGRRKRYLFTLKQGSSTFTCSRATF